MILIFDLDDTLYDEMTYVRSGMAAVAQFGQAAWGLDAGQSFDRMMGILGSHGRGQVFDLWLREQGLLTRGRVDMAIRAYRLHRPSLTLWPEAEAVLSAHQGKVPLYLVTDGHKGVQARKVDALNLWPRFRRCYLTNRYGRAAAKPALTCFDLIRRREACDWRDMVYVGDNPAKDFVGLNRMGGRTVRVMTGGHAQVEAADGFDGQVRIATLAQLPKVLRDWFGDQNNSL